MNIRTTTVFLIVSAVIIVLASQSCFVKKSVPVESVDSSLIAPPKPTVDTEYYTTVEKQASFQNGDIYTFMPYLKKNTKYPAAALKKKQQGTTVVQFGIDCYGNVNIFGVLKSSGFKILDNEAVRALKASPKWSPAKIKDVSVGQLFMLQIKFNAKTRRVEIKL